MKLLDHLLPWRTPRDDYLIIVQGDGYWVCNIPTYSFEELPSHLIGLDPDDFWPFIKRWINEDNGEYVRGPEGRYPEARP